MSKIKSGILVGLLAFCPIAILMASQGETLLETRQLQRKTVQKEWKQMGMDVNRILSKTAKLNTLNLNN